MSKISINGLKKFLYGIINSHNQSKKPKLIIHLKKHLKYALKFQLQSKKKSSKRTVAQISLHWNSSPPIKTTQITKRSKKAIPKILPNILILQSIEPQLITRKMNRKKHVNVHTSNVLILLFSLKNISWLIIITCWT